MILGPSIIGYCIGIAACNSIKKSTYGNFATSATLYMIFNGIKSTSKYGLFLGSSILMLEKLEII